MKKDTVKLQVEVTDTFGGEANYSWVRRYTIEVPEQHSSKMVVRRAKKAAGWENVRTMTDYLGDTWTLHPVGMCQVMFIDYKET